MDPADIAGAFPGEGSGLIASIENRWPKAKIFVFTAHADYKKLYYFKNCIEGFFSKVDGFDDLVQNINLI